MSTIRVMGDADTALPPLPQGTRRTADADTPARGPGRSSREARDGPAELWAPVAPAVRADASLRRKAISMRVLLSVAALPGCARPSPVTVARPRGASPAEIDRAVVSIGLAPGGNPAGVRAALPRRRVGGGRHHGGPRRRGRAMARRPGRSRRPAGDPGDDPPLEGRGAGRHPGRPLGRDGGCEQGAGRAPGAAVVRPQARRCRSTSRRPPERPRRPCCETRRSRS